MNKRPVIANIDLLLITPPFTQLNTPYPATAYLKGFLNTKGIASYQMDLGIEVILQLFTKVKLKSIFENLIDPYSSLSPNSQRIYALRHRYFRTIDPVISFLQGKQDTLARQITSENFLPRASRFDQLEDMDWAFGSMGIQDQAKHLGTLYLEDLSDFIIECIDPHFGFSRYAERLGQSANQFDELLEYLQQPNTLIDNIALAILEEKIHLSEFKLVCFSVPFPGNLYSAFRCAQYIKSNYPHIQTAMGGGFANTELRDLNDVRVFSFFDYISLDDGELPIELLHQRIHADTASPSYQLLKRTFHLDNGALFYNNLSLRQDYQQKDLGTPDYSDLLLSDYISVIEIANPMHSLWSDGRWNKLTMAHGCYWGKCTFCDVSLDYIKNYEPIAANLLVDRMEELIAQTGERGFHFVDEAAPPALMGAVAIEIIKRGLVVTWWTNIRFEKSFTKDLCILLKASGCIAVSGGLEVASDRLLALIKKGVTVEQVAQVTRNFTHAGIMVHAYLMYGYPTQTIQETIDSLEMVRQLFEAEIIQSGFWHQFALTAHSSIGLKPEEYGIIPDSKEISFANNDIQFTDSTGIDHSLFSYGLKKSLFNFMHGVCFDTPLEDWFDFEIPSTTISERYIEICLEHELPINPKSSTKVIWLGSEPLKILSQDTDMECILQFHTIDDFFEIELSMDLAEWLITQLSLSMNVNPTVTFENWKANFEKEFDDFDLFWQSSVFERLRDNGLVLI